MRHRGWTILSGLLLAALLSLAMLLDTGAVSAASPSPAQKGLGNEVQCWGSIEVSKTVDWGAFPPELGALFVVCADVPGAPEEQCQAVPYTGGTVQWQQVPCGQYSLSEVDPGAGWSVEFSSSTVTVAPGLTSRVWLTNTHAAYTPLTVTAKCSPDPQTTRRWCVQNANPYPVPFTYAVLGSNAQGSGSVPANGEVCLETEALPFPEQMLLFVNSMLQDTAESSDEVCNASVGDRVWLDSTYNGLQDLGEAGLAGVTVTLYTAGGASVAQTTTDGDGLYAFDHLEPGDYYLVFTAPTEYAPTLSGQGADPAADSDADPGSGRTAVFHLAAGESDSSWDAGFYRKLPQGVIAGYKFWDLDADGVWDSNEPGRGGVRIAIRDTSGVAVFRTVTSDAPGTPAHGSWHLEGTLPPGEYTIGEQLPAGWIQTYPSGEERVYRIAVLADGQLLVKDPPPGYEGAFNFGNVRPMGFKWHDVNGDGYRQLGEPLLGGWEIILRSDATGRLVARTRDRAPYLGYWFLPSPPPAGVYAVIERPREGWQQSYPRAVDAIYQIQIDANGNWELLSPAPPNYEGYLAFGNRTLPQEPPRCPDCPAAILFVSDRDDEEGEIYRMARDGSDVQRLTAAAGADASPTWHFDAQEIAFASDRDGNWEIYRMAPDGSAQVNVTRSPGNDKAPSWACERLAFQSDRDGNWEIYTTDPEGNEQVRLTDHPAADVAPAWSPDGMRLAFQSNRDGNWEIYLMDADGSNLQRLTNNPAADRHPTWSPDGEWLAFESTRSGNSDLWKLRLATGELLQLTDDPADDVHPTWMPYCESLFFGSDRLGQGDVFGMEYDGSGQRSLIVGDQGPDYWNDGLGEIAAPGYIPPETVVVHLPVIVGG